MRFREIDDSNRLDHFHLTATDKCFFLYGYTAGEGYGYSDTNSLISNLKKKPSERLSTPRRQVPDPSPISVFSTIF